MCNSAEAAAARLAELTRLLIGWNGVDARQLRVVELERQATSIRERIRYLQEGRPDREQVVLDLSLRFKEILGSFSFPKLSEAHIDNRFTPWVRENVYRKIGSTGALTLIALAWHLAIFERAVETGAAHPGFLLIDSPQKNLTARAEKDEFTDPRIVAAVYDHLLRWSETMSGRAQIILVDNRPPLRAAASVVAHYSGRSDEPPYGLIDDEVS